MQFSINSRAFLSALNAVGRVVPAKAVLQILSSFHISVGDGNITITAADTENRASMTIDALTVDTGVFCIEARFLINIIKTLPDCSVCVNVSDNGDVTITTDKNTFNAVAQKGDVFPELNFNEEDVQPIDFPTDKLLCGFSDTVGAVGTDDFHPQMMGVCLDAKDEQAVFVGTDSRRMVKSVQDVAVGIEKRCIIPTAAISALTALAAKSPNVSVKVYINAIRFQGGGFMLHSQLIKGNYPDYNRVIPKDNPFRVKIDRVDLLSAVRRVSACADSQYGVLRFDLDTDSLVISSNDTAFSRSAKETMLCEYSGQPMKIGLSADLLNGLLSSVPTKEVILSLASPDRPVVITPDGDGHDLTMLLMPMHLND